MKQVRIAFIGLGNVARALQELLITKHADIAERYGSLVQLSGVATRKAGFRIAPPDFDLQNLRPETLAAMPAVEAGGVEEWLRQTKPDVVFEMSSLNPLDGEPALSYLRAALRAGAHVVTANKGPVAYGYQELSKLAQQQGKQFLFEATCLAGAPFFSLFRQTRPLCRLLEVRAIVNVTANLILAAMEQGATLEEGITRTQEMGLAETDPSNDVDGWDAAVKISIVSQVLMGGRVLPQDVDRCGIRGRDGVGGVTRDELRAAKEQGQVVRLVARAVRTPDSITKAGVSPTRLAASDTLAGAGAGGLIAECITDTMPPFAVSARNISPVSTAYDVLADFVETLR